MVEVMVSPSQVRLELTGWDIFWSLKRNLTFPVAGIYNVYADPTATRPWRLVQLKCIHFSSRIPGVVEAGIYIGKKREFWCIHCTGRSVVFELEGSPYDRVVVDVRDPEAVVQRVRAACYGSETNV